MPADLFGSTPATHPPHILLGDKRKHGEFYTDDRLARAICRVLGTMAAPPLAILEPGCGGGAFLRAASAEWPKAMLVGVDLAPACSGPGSVVEGDLFKTAGKYGLVVGNPDFAIAERVVRHCLGLLAPGGHLAFLLRSAFLGSEGRVALYTEFPLRAFAPIAQRPSFTGDGKTDPMEYGLYVWQQGFRGRGEILPPLVWR